MNINPLAMVKYANDEYLPEHKPNFVRAATVAAGPLGNIVANTLAYGFKRKNSSAKGFKYSRSFEYDSTKDYPKKPKAKFKFQSGYLDDNNLSNFDDMMGF